ncbi:hypothetical protein F0M18_14275 [Pseudohalioglobus sediminis]|uniref:Uncharacterized protein n=1 Tax=Pseudohalioglobus sediminis TaxID=2606449 RepID=A0A5B0WUI1_9GAMM|nr:hypothetical protein [Pseudohalioglobus sediminis]KAA1189519.1 hypothetical protein F0M18_14275 [Pseudohalioglobus sediminis]
MQAVTASLTRPLSLLLLLAGALLYLSYGYTEMAGSDMWWHLAAGRELVQTGSAWMVDDWSFSRHGEDWLNHEWFADLLYYGWVSLFGVESIVYWKWLVVVCTFLVLQVTLQRQSGDAIAAFIAAGLAAAIAAPFIDVRPHLYTLLFYCLLLYMALERSPPRRWLLPLFLLWVNLHGGFFFGLMALAILLFPWRRFSLPGLRVAVVTGLLCAAVCLLNPSGFKTFLYPLVYAFDDSSPYRGLGEWLSPFAEGGIRSPLFFYFMWAPLAGLLYCLPSVRRVTGVPWEGLLLTGLTLAMALTSRRFIPIYAISLALLLAPLLAAFFSQVRIPALRFAVAAVALVFALLRLAPYPLQAAPAFHYLTAEYNYPEDTVSFMQANGLSGNVYAYYNWGGYLHWRSDGELRVYIDGRADTVYNAENYYHYVGVLGGAPGWVETVESSGAQFMLWPYAQRGGQAKLQELLATGRWRPLYQDSVSWLAARTTVKLPDEAIAPPTSPVRQLTRAMVMYRRGDYDRSLETVRAVREAVPWQKTACQLQATLLRANGDARGAAAVLLDCYSYFPTAMLR